ncbi:MAG: alkaline phosphatase family protein [Alphaproteobacteria bacterium]
MSARVVAIGFDAAEATLIERWAAEGLLPTFARLTRMGAVYRLDNCLETLPGAIWPELTSGRSCGKVPLYYHPRQLHTGEARVRAVREDEVDPEDYYWTRASRAGCRVAVIDQPQTVRSAGLNGLQLFEWGLHDRNFAIVSDPPEVLDRVRSRYGAHPITSCDRHGRTHGGYARLLRGLLDGADRKTALLLDVLSSGDWDLFSAAFGESHCVGHQFWHFLDPTHPDHDPNAPMEFRHAIQSVYQRLDRGLGALIEAAGPEARVIAYTSHGMGPYTGGPQLLPEVLVRLGLGSARPSAKTVRTGPGALIRHLQTKISHIPRPLQPFARRMAETAMVRRVQAMFGSLLDPLESPMTKAAALRNNRCGAIRINRKGREPFGSVATGEECDALLDDIRRALTALIDPTSGQRIVVRTVTATEAFGPDHHPDVPDLMVVFRTDLGRLERCYSERVGDVTVPLFHPNIPRTGDHTVESRLWIAGPGIAAAETRRGNVLDLAPTVLSFLGLPLPAALDGQPLPSVPDRMDRAAAGIR